MVNYFHSTKPKKPVQMSKVRRTIDLEDILHIAELLSSLPKGVDHVDLLLEIPDPYGDERECAVVWFTPETDGEFEVRVGRYDSRMADYQDWMLTHKQEIVEEAEREAKVAQNRLEELKGA